MPVTKEDWMKALSYVSDAEGLKATVKGSIYGSVLIGVVAMVFSLLLGPVGLLFGGTVGGCLAFYKTWGTYKPLSSVMKELTPAQKDKLYAELADIRAKISVQDYMELILLLQGNTGLLVKKQVLDVLIDFVRRTLNMDVK